MQPVSIESSQSGRSAAAVPSFQESNYVGLTLKEFHSPANLKESLDLMLSFDMSKSPSHPADVLQQFKQDHHGLPVQEGISFRQEQGYHGHQRLALVSSTCTSEHLPAQNPAPSAQMLEWKDTESTVEDLGGTPIWMKDVECFRDLLADPEDKERKEQVQNQNQDPFHKPHSFINMISQGTSLHGWANNAVGDSTSRNQSDLLGRVQFTPHCNTFSCNISGSSAGARHSRSPASMSVYDHYASCPMPAADIDPSFCSKIGYSSLGTAAAENQTPPSQSTRGNILRLKSAPSPAAEVLNTHANVLMRHSSMNLQLNVGLNTSEVIQAQGAKATSSSQGLSVPPTLYLSDQNQWHEVASACSEESLKANSGMHVSTTYGRSNMNMPGQNKLPPLDLKTALGKNVHPAAAAADSPSPQNTGKSPQEKSNEGLTFARNKQEIFAAPLFGNLSSLLRANSAPVAYTPEPFGKLSSVDVQLTNGHECNNVQGRNLVTPDKKAQPRRSRFDRRVQPCTFVTERLRREKLTDSYNTLKSLLPSFNKSDRASILEETIAQVKHLQNKKIELEKLKQEKLMKLKRQRAEAVKGQDGVEHEESGEGNCQWLKKTSRHGTEVDMRIFEDEIHVSIIQKHLPRFLLRMVTALETKLKLDIMNATGSVIDGFDVYNFKVKIRGNSCVLANEIMTKIIDTLDSVF